MAVDPTLLRTQSPRAMVSKVPTADPENKLLESLTRMSWRICNFPFAVRLAIEAAYVFDGWDRESFPEVMQHASYLKDAALTDLVTGIRAVYDHDPTVLGAGCALSLLRKPKLRQSVLDIAAAKGAFAGDDAKISAALEFVEDVLSESAVSAGTPDDCASTFAIALGHVKWLGHRQVAHMTYGETDVCTNDLVHIVRLSMLFSAAVDTLIGAQKCPVTALEGREQSAKALVKKVLGIDSELQLFRCGVGFEFRQVLRWPQRFMVFNPPPNSTPGDYRVYRVKEPRHVVVERLLEAQGMGAELFGLT